MDPDQPILVGDHPALDFLNSIAAPRGTPVDSIADGGRYVAWLEAAGLLQGGQANAARRRFPAAALDRVAAEARELREWLRHELERHAASGSQWPTASAVGKINKLLDAGTSRARLAPSGNGWALTEEMELERASQLLVPVGRAIADLAAAADWSLVRRCANPQCPLWFRDRTKAHSRLYCSASLCGNRAKVAAFRERQRKAAR